MKASLALQFFLCLAGIALAQPKDNQDAVAVQFAASVAKKFLDAVDRKRPDVAERYSYFTKRELPSGKTLRAPSIGEGVANTSIQAREKLGKLLSRQLVETMVLKDHRGLPDSKFVEFRYELKFEKKDKIRETLKIKVEGEQKGKVVFFASG